MKLLDEKGLTTVWAAIKNTFTSKSDADEKYAKKTDLADYATKSQAMHSMDVYHTEADIQISLKGVNDFQLGFIAMNAVTSQSAGVMIPSDKTKLDGIAENANNYSLPLAATSTRGGIQLGYSQNGRNYPVQLSGEKAYVNVPWTDTNTTYDLSSYSQKDETVKNISNSILGASTSGYKQILEIGYANGTTKNVEISNASGGLDGFMSASDKNKLDNIAAGANNYTLPVASTNTLGGIKTGYSDNDTINWPVKVDDNNNAYVPNVSSLCKFNIVYLIKDCVSNRLNLLIPDGRKVNLDDIMDEEGIVIFAILTDPSDVTCSVGFVYNNEEDIYNQKTLSGPFLITAGGGIVNVYSL